MDVPTYGQCCGAGPILTGSRSCGRLHKIYSEYIRNQLHICGVLDPDPTHISKEYLEIIFKNTLNSIKMNNLPTICFFLFYTTSTGTIYYHSV